MTAEDVIRLGKHLHAGLVGKTIEVEYLNFYRSDDNSHYLHGPFKVTVLPPEEAIDFEEISDDLYDPNWSVSPFPNQGIPDDARTFWCSPVTCDLNTGQWTLAFKEVSPPPPELVEYRVELSGMAYMRGTYYVHAKDAADAERLARENTGDVEWKYNGVDDSTIEVESVSPR